MKLIDTFKAIFYPPDPPCDSELHEMFRLLSSNPIAKPEPPRYFQGPRPTSDKAKLIQARIKRKSGNTSKSQMKAYRRVHEALQRPDNA